MSLTELLKRILMPDKRTSTITRVELEIGEHTRRFLEGGLPIGETSVTQKLDAIIEMLLPVSDLRLMNSRLEIIHELVSKGSSQETLTAINNLTRKVDTMSSNIDRIEKEAADAAENVGLVRTAIEGLKTIQEEMKTEITALKEQVAKGQLDQARLDAAAATFEKADEDLDALVLPPAPPAEPPVEG